MPKITDKQVTWATYLGASIALGGAYAMGRGWHKLGLALTVSGIGVPLFLRKQWEARGPARLLEDCEGNRQRCRLMEDMTDSDLHRLKNSIEWKASWISYANKLQFNNFFIKQCSCEVLWEGVGRDQKRRREILKKSDDLSPLKDLLESLDGAELTKLFDGIWDKATNVLSEDKLLEILEKIDGPNSVQLAKQLEQSKLYPELLKKVCDKLRQKIRSQLIKSPTILRSLSKTTPLPSPDLVGWLYNSDTLPYLFLVAEDESENWMRKESLYVMIKSVCTWANRFKKPNIEAVMKCVDWFKLPDMTWNRLLYDGLLTVGSSSKLWDKFSVEQKKTWRESLETAVKTETVGIYKYQVEEVNKVLKLFDSNKTVETLIKKNT